MLPIIDYSDLPRAAQRLMARSQNDEAVTLPRRSFLKLARQAAWRSAPSHLLMAQATGQSQRAQTDGTAIGLRADRRQRRSDGDDQPAGVRTGRADRIADDPAEELGADWSLRGRHGSNDGAYIDPRFGIHITSGSNSIEQFYAVSRARRSGTCDVARCRNSALESGRHHPARSPARCYPDGRDSLRRTGRAAMVPVRESR
jgi:isoquinoline 1-oxidoreductase beta subunit